MTFALIAALAVYACVTSITPGPNNTMLLASGANFGFRATIPHLLGVNLGCSMMLLLIGLGAGGLLTAAPAAHEALRYVGVAYLLYLAWKIGTSDGMADGGKGGRPLNFLQAAGFQWVNPKAWIMCAGAITTYTPEDGFFLNIVIVAIVFALVNGPCIVTWAAFGAALRGFLQRPLYLRIFNVSMALLLVASLYPLLYA